MQNQAVNHIEQANQKGDRLDSPQAKKKHYYQKDDGDTERWIWVAV